MLDVQYQLIVVFQRRRIVLVNDLLQIGFSPALPSPSISASSFDLKNYSHRIPYIYKTEFVSTRAPLGAMNQSAKTNVRLAHYLKLLTRPENGHRYKINVPGDARKVSFRL
jgi:hypothetical protein